MELYKFSHLIIYSGMKNKQPHPSELSAEELQLIERLRDQPEVRERFETILEITARGEGPLPRADEIEERLIQEMRRLGKATLESWARRAESRLGEQLQQQDPSAGVRKKKR